MGRLKMEPAKTPKQRQTEEEEDHEQEQVHMNGHNNPRCLKWRAWRTPVSGKISRVESDCQAIGREVRIVHHHETLYHRLGSLKPNACFGRCPGPQGWQDLDP